MSVIKPTRDVLLDGRDGADGEAAEAETAPEGATADPFVFQAEYDGAVAPNAREAECSECGWVGTVDESLESDGRSDSCPECGHGALTYHLS